MSGLVDFIQNVLWVELDNEPNVAISSFAKKFKIFFHLDLNQGSIGSRDLSICS